MIKLSVFAQELGTKSVLDMGRKAGLKPPISVRALAQAVGHPLEPINLIPNGRSLPLGDVQLDWTDPGFGSIRQTTRWVFNIEQTTTRATIAAGAVQGPSAGAELVLTHAALTYGTNYSWGIHAENDYSPQQYSAYAKFDIDPKPAPPPAHPPPRPPVMPGGPGYSDVQIYNCHVEHRLVHIWVRTWPPSGGPPTLNYLGEFKDQYNNMGQCPWEDNGAPADPFTVPVEFGKKLESNTIYEIFCVDPEALGCTVGATDQLIIETQACVRISQVIKGNKDGDTFTFRVD